MSSTATRIIKNSGFLYLRIAVVTFLSLYTTRLILDVLGASDFGIYSIVGGVIAMLGFLNGAMASATQRFMSYSEGENDKEKQKRIFNISLCIHFAISLLLVVLLVIAGVICFLYVLNIPADRLFVAKVVYGCLVLSTAFSVSSVPYEAVLNAHENMLYYSIVGILDAALRLAVAISLYYVAFDKLMAYGVMMAIIPLITLTIMRWYCHTHYEECKISLIKYYNKAQAKEMVTFAGWNFLSKAGNVIVMQGSSVVLNAFGGVLVNAAHGIANQLAGYLLVFSSNMQKALSPVIVKKEGEHNRQQMLAFSLAGNKFSYLLFAFFAIPVCIEMPYILQLWLKEPPEYAVLFCRLIVVRRLIGQLTSTFATSIGATGDIKQNSIMNAVIMGLALPAACLCYMMGAPIYIMYIVLIAMVILMGVCDTYYMWKQCDLRVNLFFKSVILPCLLITILTFMVGMPFHWLMPVGFVRLACVLVACFLACMASGYAIGITAREKNVINGLVTNIFAKVCKKL